MSTEPTNSAVASAVGIEESQIERFRTETLRLADGSWLVLFSYLMPKELRHSFTGSFTVIIANPPVPHDRRRDD